MSYDEDEVELSYESLEHETGAAWLLVIEGEKVWLPKSRCSIDEDAKVVVVPEWLAVEKGLV